MTDFSRSSYPRRPRTPGPAQSSAAGLRASVREFLRSEDGPTAVEYAVMLALILATIFGTVGVVGGTAGGLFSNAESELEAVGF
ncbi:MAG: hypothetical protein AAF907_00175 [Planctomycetota bacterium]